MKRPFTIIFLLSLILFNVSGATLRSLSGTIVDETTGKLLKGAIVTLLNQEGSRKEWMVTGGEGVFTLKNVTPRDSVTISMMGYNKETLSVDSLLKCDVITILLTPKAYRLKGVTVKAKPITTRGDTLVYNVASFKTESDRYLGDVLNRMPGIEMSSSGSIKFQDKSINNFYIQGRDMLGARYGIASRNLDVDAIAAVEVIPDNQHIKALNGKVTSGQPGINIRLKNGFLVKPFGEVEIGGGIPSIYSGRIFTTLITKSVQALVSLNGGNDGQNRLADISDANELISGMLPGYTGGWLTNSLAMAPPVSRKNYIFERAYAATANVLVPLSNYSDLKLNLNYGGSRTTLTNNFTDSYIIGENDRISIKRSNNSLSHLKRMKMAATYELNSPIRYFKDALTYYHDRTTTESDVLNNGTPVNSLIKYAPWYVSNEFKTLLTHGDHVFTISSTMRGGNHSECLDATYNYLINTESLINTINENLSRRYFTTSNIIKTDFQISREVRLAMTTGFDFTHRLISTKTNGDFPTDEDFQLNTDWITPLNRVNAYITPSTFLSFFDSRLKLSMRLPVQFYTMSTYQGNEANSSKFFLAPYINATYTFNSSWNMTGQYSRNFKYADEKSMLFEPFITSIRTIYIPTQNSFHSLDNRGEININHRNILALLYMTITARYTSTRSNYAPISTYTNQWTYISAKSTPNNASRFEIDCNLSKNIGANLLRITVTPYFSNTKTDFYQNDIYMRSNSNTYSLSLSAEANKQGILGIKYDIQGRISQSKSKGYSPSTSYGLAQELNINIYTIPKLILTVKPQHNVIQTAPSTFKNYCFLFAGASYLWKKWNFILRAEDLLNNKYYRVETISPASTSLTEIPLRGRSISLNVKFKF
ncbi:MAG: carboxypeptidase-like regulatory domain-containing protein [Muribaculaceae bacterium]|nr:carboxypeptidase-like regulatory domain-containing protein [Muribaculaceae bacterium]